MESLCILPKGLITLSSPRNYHNTTSTTTTTCSSIKGGNCIWSLHNPSHGTTIRFFSPRSAASITAASPLCFFNPIPLPLSCSEKTRNKGKAARGFGAVCYAGPPFSTYNLSWISALSSLVLMLSKGTAIHKSFLVPLFALQAPASVISWIKGDYGIWTAFLAIVVRLFFFIPGELELPFMALLLVIVAPYQVMNLRGTQQGAIIALVIAGYLAFQHFSWAGNLQKAFDQGSLVATLATIFIAVISFLLLI